MVVHIDDSRFASLYHIQVCSHVGTCDRLSGLQSVPGTFQESLGGPQALPDVFQQQHVRNAVFEYVMDFVPEYHLLVPGPDYPGADDE